jgi:hypothetical protein
VKRTTRFAKITPFDIYRCCALHTDTYTIQHRTAKRLSEYSRSRPPRPVTAAVARSVLGNNYRRGLAVPCKQPAIRERVKWTLSSGRRYRRGRTVGSSRVSALRPRAARDVSGRFIFFLCICAGCVRASLSTTTGHTANVSQHARE